MQNNIFTIRDVQIKQYSIMYFFGTWHTHMHIYAETDKEAIFDADAEMTTGKVRTCVDKLPFALFLGNRRIKTYSTPEIFTQHGITA